MVKIVVCNKGLFVCVLILLHVGSTDVSTSLAVSKTDPLSSLPQANVTSTDPYVTYLVKYYIDIKTVCHKEILFFSSPLLRMVPVGKLLHFKCLNILILDRCCDIGLLSAYGIYIDFGTC